MDAKYTTDLLLGYLTQRRLKPQEQEQILSLVQKIETGHLEEFEHCIVLSMIEMIEREGKEDHEKCLMFHLEGKVEN